MNENDLLGQALKPMVEKVVSAEIEKLGIEAQIKSMLEDVASKASKIITVKLDGEEGEGRKMPLVHKQFEDLLAVTQIQGMNVLLTGGAGLSKSTAVMQVAEAFKLEMGAISFSNQTTKTDLMGFVDANGIYRKSSFVDSFENGKIFLADEMDACSANVLVLLNSAISNGFIETPDNKLIYAHENFRFVGTANTNLRGAKDGFTARNKLDGATIDRFTVIEWQLDEELEEKLTNNNGWLTIVRKCREVANKELDGIVITPRSSYDGAKLLRAGVDVEKVIKMTILRAVGKDTESVLLKGITENMKSQAQKDGGRKRTPSTKTEVVDTKITVELDEKDVIGAEDVDDFKW